MDKLGKLLAGKLGGEVGAAAESMLGAMAKVEATAVEGVAGGGLVRVRVTASASKCVAVAIDPVLVEQLLARAASAASARGILEDTVRAAVSDALRQALETRQDIVRAAVPFPTAAGSGSGSPPLR